MALPYSCSALKTENPSVNFHSAVQRGVARDYRSSFSRICKQSVYSWSQSVSELLPLRT